MARTVGILGASGFAGGELLRLVAGHPDLEFSLSRSGERIVCAFARDTEVGVDVERVDDNGGWAGPARRALSAAERAELDALPAQDRARRFYVLWARKEALAKATGHGLVLPLREIDLTAAGQLRGLPEAAGTPEEWTLRDIDVREGFAAALAVRAPDVRVRMMGTADLLARTAG